jgi:hypothetical protein
MMDKAFLEFWGNVFLNAARSGKQMDDIAAMMKGMSSGSPDMSGLIGRVTAPEIFMRSTEEYLKAFRKAGEDLNEIMKGCLYLMDLVPRKDYDELKGKYEELRKRIHENTGGPGDGILKEELMLQAEGMKVFEGLLREQARQFQSLISEYSQSSPRDKESGGTATRQAGKEGLGGGKGDRTERQGKGRKRYLNPLKMLRTALSGGPLSWCPCRSVDGIL